MLTLDAVLMNRRELHAGSVGNQTHYCMQNMPRTKPIKVVPARHVEQAEISAKCK